MNIHEYFAIVIKPCFAAVSIPRWDELDSDEWPLDCVCGQISRRIIDKAADLLYLMVAAGNTKQRLVDAVQHEILVVCFG